MYIYIYSIYIYASFNHYDLTTKHESPMFGQDLHVQLRHPRDAAGGPPPAESPAAPKHGNVARGGER